MKKAYLIIISFLVVAILLALSEIPSQAQTFDRDEETEPVDEETEVEEPPIDWATVSITGHEPGDSGASSAPPATNTTPPAPPTAAEAPVGATYVVQAGDTLYEIARQFGVSLADLITVNQIADPRRIMPGQVLVLPDSSVPAEPAPPSAAPPPAAPPPGAGTYVVQAGDTLSDIARRLGVGLGDLAAANGITNPNRIQVGQVLLVPQTAVSPPSPPAPAPTPVPPPAPDPGNAAYYTVAPGDSLHLIANRFGVTVQAIVAANAIPDARLIHVGQRLLIPDPATTVPAPNDPSPGMFIWPTERRALYQYFGGYHRAIDIDVAVYSPVFAAAGGTVEFSGWNSSGYGYLVVLDHGDGIRSLYAHNAELKVKTEDHVNQGDLIATSGSTGYSTAPHVHFAILVHGQAVNPCLYLPDGCG